MPSTPQRNLTPYELRQMARQKLHDAKSLLTSNSFDTAAYLAGYAPELALKARFCTKNRWKDFPADRFEAIRRGGKEVFTHDLNKLLTLSDTAFIQESSLQHIDWTRAVDWDSEKRYEPVGSTDPEHASLQIAETERLLYELTMFEAVERLMEVEVEVSNTNGPFNLFAVCDRFSQPHGWELTISARWMIGDTDRKLTAIGDRVRTLDSDLQEVIKSLVHYHPDDERVFAFNSLGVARHSIYFVSKDNLVVHSAISTGTLLLPPAYIITNDRSPPLDYVTATRRQGRISIKNCVFDNSEIG